MIVLLLGIGYGGYQAINSPSTTTSTVQDDRVTKPAKKKTPAKKTKKSHNKSQSNTATSQSSAVNTRATSQGVAPSSSGTVQSGQSGSAGGHTTTDQPSASPVTPSTVPDTEPNSIVGDSSTMTYYLPGQAHQIADDNIVYFDFVKEAEEAGYHPAN